MSKNALIAKSGFAMEKCLEMKVILDTIRNQLVSLAEYDKNRKREYLEYPCRKKTDVCLRPYGINIQIKRVASFDKDRGHHVDRRKLKDFCEHFDNNEEIQELIKQLMITKSITQKGKEHLATLLSDKKKIFSLIFDLLLGNDKMYQPTHIMFVDSSQENMYMFYVCSIHALMGHILKTSVVSVKETCVHIGKNIYFQRRGGQKTDKNPNDIQTKLKLTPEIKHLSHLVYVCDRKFVDDCIDNISNNAVS
jgi:hypothetical protein